MNQETHHIETRKTARFYSLGKLDADTKVVYFALHGYGQQAERLLRKFDALGNNAFIIAPEALSRFYWNEKTGQTGASWMTKDDRDYEIADYCHFLQAVYEHFLSNIPQEATIVLLGFSQGGATAMRWLLLNRPARIGAIQLWGCDIPADLDYKSAEKYLSDKKLFWIYGDADPYLGSDRVTQLEKRFAQFQLSPEIIVFKGEHEVERATLLLLHYNMSE